MGIHGAMNYTIKGAYLSDRATALEVGYGT